MPNDLIAFKVLEGRQDADKYIETLKMFNVPIMKFNIKHKIGLEQDNCHIHVANVTWEFVKTQHFDLIVGPQILQT